MLHFAKSSYQNISIYLMFSHCFKFSVAFVVVIVVNDFLFKQKYTKTRIEQWKNVSRFINKKKFEIG